MADDENLGKFGAAVRQLLGEEHQIVVVHGCLNGLGDFSANDFGCWPPDHLPVNTDGALLSIGARVNKKVVALLGRRGVPAIGLCGMDGSTVRLRKKKCVRAGRENLFETAAVDPFWLEAITKNGGVPVIAGVGLTADDHYEAVCPDQLASICAATWHAHTLIFLTHLQGIKNGDGQVMRWLGSQETAALIESSYLPGPLLSKLVASYCALQQGVHRVRILPMSHVASLGVFYNERIDVGTEILAPVDRPV